MIKISGLLNFYFTYLGNVEAVTEPQRNVNRFIQC